MQKTWKNNLKKGIKMMRAMENGGELVLYLLHSGAAPGLR